MILFMASSLYRVIITLSLPRCVRPLHSINAIVIGHILLYWYANTASSLTCLRSTTTTDNTRLLGIVKHYEHNIIYKHNMNNIKLRH
jgi:hypothetical protein